ncbi:phage head closure protein [Cronobacter muytjensii]
MKRTPSLTSAEYSLPDPGDLDKRVTFRKRLDTPAADFGTDLDVQETFKAWAKVRNTGSAAYQASVQTDEKLTHYVTIRFRRKLSTEWEVVLPSGEVLRIQRMRDLNSERRFWLLECESLGAEENYSGAVYG